MKVNIFGLFGEKNPANREFTENKAGIAKPMFEKAIKTVMITIITVSTKILVEDFAFTDEMIDKFMTRFMKDLEEEKSKWLKG